MTTHNASLDPRLRRGFAVAVVALAAVAISACGGPSSGSTSSSQSTPTPAKQASKNLTLPDICTLVTTDDAAKIWNVDKTQVMNMGSAAGAGLCIYGNQASPQDGLLVIGQSYPDATSAQAVQPEQLAAIYSRLYGISNAKSVSGIGDKAFEYTTTSAATGSSGAAIFVFKANILIMIILSPASDTSGVESLARTALSRLS